ncbi:MAG TPA: amidohydrolase family protein, partial [Burkholderiales bacterium]
ELLLPLALKWAEETGAPLATALSRVTMAPAGIMGIDAGHLSLGATADLCIFDPDAWWTVGPRALKSQGRNSPFLGLELRGRVRYTLVAGHIVFEA